LVVLVVLAVEVLEVTMALESHQEPQTLVVVVVVAPTQEVEVQVEMAALVS
jgi:hypothetical protein